MTYNDFYGKIKNEPLKRFRGEKVKHLKRKLKSALIILVICLIAFIGFSKAGILFSVSGGDVITVSTTKKTFEPNMYVASVGVLSDIVKEDVTTTVSTTKSVTVTTKTVTKTTAIVQETTTTSSTWDGPVLTKSKGVVEGPSGKETYYNLNMNGVIKIMRNAGFSEEEYPYWVREDGVKMLGNYVMVAANLSLRPRGSIIQSSLGDAIVCDTGSFAHSNQTQLDIAVTW